MHTTPCGTLLFCAFLLASVQAAASVPPAPLPPAGWEQRITPGFEPAVEAVVARLPQYQMEGAAKFNQLWEGWGEGAAEVLFKTAADPAWKEFQGAVAYVLVMTPFPAVMERIESEIRAGAARHAESDEYGFWRTLLIHYGHAQKDRAYPLVVELSKSPDPKVAETAISQLFAYHTPEALEAARNAVAALPADAAERWSHSLKHAEGFLRAKEPMSAAPAAQPKKDRKP